ncbi:hypothetical protein [Bacillus cereus]|uniref:hypothetical protein n=1 Tax=Bacillus cereus TaxID=1396 RepID=UPI001C8BA2B5|nr:hypothetical protein [Bacillus cereus]MBX9158757.1 hypothetical protein [Bacillus cereus]
MEALGKLEFRGAHGEGDFLTWAHGDSVAKNGKHYISMDGREIEVNPETVGYKVGTDHKGVSVFIGTVVAVKGRETKEIRDNKGQLVAADLVNTSFYSVETDGDSVMGLSYQKLIIDKHGNLHYTGEELEIGELDLRDTEVIGDRFDKLRAPYTPRAEMHLAVGKYHSVWKNNEELVIWNLHESTTDGTSVAIGRIGEIPEISQVWYYRELDAIDEYGRTSDFYVKYNGIYYGLTEFLGMDVTKLDL